MFLLPQIAHAATCTLNGAEVPCSEIPSWIWSIPIVFGVLSLVGFVFWIAMLIDAINNEKENKTVWVIVIVFLNLLGAIIYYFAAKQPRQKVGQTSTISTTKTGN
jgi:hypothetical protein